MINNLKDKAFELRMNNESYSEISKKLGISKSTLSGWFKNNINSQIIKNILVSRAQEKASSKLKLMSIAHKEKWDKIHLSYRKEASKNFSKLTLNQFFVPGILVYWGEGDKVLKNGIVRIANTDFRLLKIFIKFLTNSCEFPKEKIKLWMLLYRDLNENICKEYWSRSLDLPKEQFIKTQFITGREKKKKITNGVCYVQVYSRELKEKIIEWINIYFNKLDIAGII